MLRYVDDQVLLSANSKIKCSQAKYIFLVNLLNIYLTFKEVVSLHMFKVFHLFDIVSIRPAQSCA